jgi:ketosteroid isomerase-like protein
MKKVAVLGFLFIVALAMLANAADSNSKSADQVKKLEQDWAKATVTNGGAAVDQYEADDIIDTDPGGQVTTKAQDRQAATSGDLKFESLEPSEIVVHVYGNTAVAAGVVTVKGTYKQQDISGKYRFTDTWVNHDGKWQVVASQATKISG